MEMKAAVFRKVHEPLTIESVEIDKPWGREVLVRTAATGVCHSDLHVVDGQSAIAAGSADRARPRGRRRRRGGRRRGDHACGRAITWWPASPASAAAARSAWAATRTSASAASSPAPESAAPRLSQKGAPVRQFIGISSYAERMLLHENSIVKIDPDLPLDRAALVGCGVLTGVGAALRTVGAARPGRPSPCSAAAAWGCRSSRARASAAPARSSASTCSTPSWRWPSAWAPPTSSTARKDDPVKAVRALTGGAGVDHAFEAVGNATLVRQAIESLAIRGTATIVGVLPPDAMIEFPWMAIRPECRVQTSRMGSNRFRIDIPRYLEFYRQGRLLLDEMVTRRGRLDDINEAFRAMKAGEVARTVLTF